MIPSVIIPGTASLRGNIFCSGASNEMAHALLFVGADGGGALPFALQVAALLLCENPTKDGACGTCPGCRKAVSFDHPDLYVVLPVNTNREIKRNAVTADYISEWKKHYAQSPYTTLYEWLQELNIGNKQGSINVAEVQNMIRFLSLKSYEANHKVIVIWRPELMQNAAGNKLLKAVEEPTHGTHFLFVSAAPQDILVTLRSRCQRVDVPKPADEALLRFLVEQGQQEAHAADIVFMADGNINMALNMVHDKDSGTDDIHKLFVQWMRDCYAIDFFACNEFVNNLAKSNREEQKQLLQYGLSVFRDAISLNNDVDMLIRQKGDKLQWMRKFVPFLGDHIADLCKIFNEGIRDLQRNANAKILFMDLSLKTMKFLHRKKRPLAS